MSVLVIGADEITPIKAVKRSVSCVFCEYCKVFGLDKEFGCKE